jgi:ribosomal-protein-alanine N-acetyltransferase
MAGSHALRPACREDANSLAAIDASVSASPWGESQFAVVCGETLQSRETVLIIHQHTQVDGFIVYSQVLDEVSVHNIAIRKSRHGQGLGHLLLKASLERMKREGAARCLLEVRQSNTIARRLYERNGFALDGSRKNYYPGREQREDALLMSRDL